MTTFETSLSGRYLSLDRVYPRSSPRPFSRSTSWLGTKGPVGRPAITGLEPPSSIAVARRFWSFEKPRKRERNNITKERRFLPALKNWVSTPKKG